MAPERELTELPVPTPFVGRADRSWYIDPHNYHDSRPLAEAAVAHVEGDRAEQAGGIGAPASS